jgi:uncharacterized membrane protein YdjX (TVP38/TMEM64 family)
MENEPKRKFDIKSAVVAFLTIVGIGVILAFLYKYIGIDKIKAFISTAGIFGPLIFILSLTATIVVAPLGGEVLLLSGGVLFGFWPGVVYIAISGFIGATINFWVSRIYGKRLVTKLIGVDNFHKLNEITNKITDKNPLVILPLMATTAFDYISYAAGLTNIKFSKYFLIVILSTCINVPIYVGLGTSIIQPNGIFLKVFIGLVFIALISVGVEEFWRRRGKKKVDNLEVK